MKRLVLLALLGLAVACGRDEESAPGPEPKTLSATLDLELRDSADVALTLVGDRLHAELTLSNGHGVAPAAELIAGDGHVEAIPEAQATLYTARFSLPPTDGPCAAEPVSLALSLHRAGDGSHVAGSLTAYCGKDRFFGVPARTPLRLSGQMTAP